MILGKGSQSQNLASQVSNAVVRPPGFYKSIALDILCLISALAVGFGYRMYLFGQWPLAWTLLLCIPLATFSVLDVFLMRGMPRRMLVLFGEVVGLLFFFYDLPPKTIGLLAIFMYALLLWGDWRAYREAANSVQVRFFRTATPILKKMTTALIIAGIVLYLPQWRSENAFLSEPDFKTLYTWVLDPIKGFYPNIRLGSSTQAFAESVVQEEVKNTKGFENMLPDMQRQIIEKSISETIAGMQRSLRVSFEATESFSAVLYRAIRIVFDDWQKQFGIEFMLAWSVIVFIALRGLGVIYYGLLGTVAFMCYQLLIAANWIQITGESQMREVIQYT